MNSMLYNMWNPTHRTMLQTLKWSENGELSQLDMEKVLNALKDQKTAPETVVEHKETALSTNK